MINFTELFINDMVDVLPSNDRRGGVFHLYYPF